MSNSCWTAASTPASGTSAPPPATAAPPQPPCVPTAPLLAARAHHRRGEVLEETAGRQPALHAYRESWEQWQRAGEDTGPEAQRTRARMRALDG